MRIGIDARELAGRPTGVGRYLAELVARWSRAPWAAGDALVLFSPAPLDPASPWHGSGGATCTLVHAPGAGGARWEQFTMAAAARRATLDVFFAPGYSAPLGLARPSVVAMHDVSFAAHPEWFRAREGLRQRVLARHSARRAARVLTLTRFSQDEIVRFLHVPREKIRVIAPAVDAHPAFRHAGTPPAAAAGQPPAAPARTILFVGSIFTRRHVTALIEAFAEVAAADGSIRLALIGADRTWPLQRIGERIAASGVADRIDWRPWLDEHDLQERYRTARVFAFPSEYEGFGLTPLEALAAGVPPVVADVPVAHEAYGDAACYVDPGDRRALVSALRLMLDDDARRRRVLEAAPAVLARYSWERTAVETYDALREAAASAP
jgi:glycosyltransferase involved in cell wall biosynthesis